MHHPWRSLPADWTVEYAALPDDLLGECHYASRTIWLDNRLSQVERRCVLEHERQHMLDPSADEEHVDQAAARSLVPLDALVSALRWSRDLREVAWECWVTLDVLSCRLTHLHPSERATVLAALQEDHHA